MSDYENINGPSFLKTTTWFHVPLHTLKSKIGKWNRLNPSLLKWFLRLSFEGTKSSLTLAKESGLYVSDLNIKTIYEDFGYDKPVFKDAFPSIPERVREYILTNMNNVEKASLMPENKMDEKLDELQRLYEKILNENKQHIHEIEELKRKLQSCEEIRNDPKWWDKVMDKEAPALPPPEKDIEIVKEIIEEIKEVEKEKEEELVEVKKEKNNLAVKLQEGREKLKTVKEKDEKMETEPANPFLEITKRRGAIAGSDDEENSNEEDWNYHINECFVCGEIDNLQTCSRCLKTSYCGKECQRRDFKRHQKLC
jgi:hypothetical protein